MVSTNTKQISDSDSPREVHIDGMHAIHAYKIQAGFIQLALGSYYISKEQLAPLKWL